MSFSLPLTQLAQSDRDWKTIALGLSWTSWCFETYLTLRQYPNYSRPEPPAVLKSHFSPDVYAKSQAYGLDKARFSLVRQLFEQLENSALIYSDVFAWAWIKGGDVLTSVGLTGDREIMQSIAFAIIMALVSALPSLPFDFYYTFVVEQKHGFNKTTKTTFVLDVLKGWLVGFCIGVPLLSAFLLIVRHMGENFIYYLMFFLLAFQLLMVVLYPLVIQPLFNKLTPLPDSSLRTRVESLASRLKFPLTHLYQIDGSKRSSHSNAYFYGLPWSKHIVIFDTLIEKQPEEEVEAVLAHELGHWSMSHPTKLLIVNQLHLFTLLSSFPPFLHSRTLLPAFGFPLSPTLTHSWRPPILPTFLMFNLLLTPLESIMQFAMNAITRMFEYQADEFAVRMGGTMGQRLAKALTALHVENLSTVHVDWLYSAYHHSHPTLPERLRAMEKMDVDVQAATQKEQKKEL